MLNEPFGIFISSIFIKSLVVPDRSVIVGILFLPPHPYWVSKSPSFLDTEAQRDESENLPMSGADKCDIFGPVIIIFSGAFLLYLIWFKLNWRW